jgi:dienelactone hydrolase
MARPEHRAALTSLVDLPADPLAGLVGAFLVYPWCGPTTMAAKHGADRRIPVDAIVAGRDSVSFERDTMRALGRYGLDGLAVNVMRYPTATHAFDDDDTTDPRFRHDPALEAKAHDAFVDFLKRVG